MKINLLILAVLAGLPAMAQKGLLLPNGSATLTNPLSQTVKLDPKQKIPPLLVNCFTSDGKPRAFACEFAIVDMQVIGRNGVLLATVTPPANVAAPATVIPVKKSQSSNSIDGPNGSGSLDYRLVLRYRRIAKPAFPTTQYTISTAHVDHPSTPSELSQIHLFSDTPSKLPSPVQTYDFIATLGYSGGNSPSLNGGDIRYIQLANPATFEKAKSPKNELSDRAEAYLRFRFGVDFNH